MKKVCIYALDDGSYSVELEPQGEGMDEGVEVPASPQDMQQDVAPEQVFASVDEALDAARALLDGGGADLGKPMIDGEEDFVAGFKQARGIDQGF